MALTKTRINALRRLGQKKHRDEMKVFIVEGLRLVRDAVESDFEILEAFVTSDLAEDPGAALVLEQLRLKCRHVERASSREMEQITDTVTPPGLLAVVRRKGASAMSLLERRDPPAVLVAVDGVSDPGNVGSIIRTCDWFGVDGVLLGRTSVDLYNPKVIRATMGGIFHLPVIDDVDLLPFITNAKSKEYSVYATDALGETHFDRVRYAQRSIIVFGNEAWGVSDQVRELADHRVSIRRYGTGESLNVSVACGIILSGLHRLMDE